MGSITSALIIKLDVAGSDISKWPYTHSVFYLAGVAVSELRYC